MATKKTKQVDEEAVTAVLREGDDLGSVGTIRVSVTPQGKKVSFDAWAHIANIPVRHRPGMLAFVSRPDIKRTVETWYSLFDGY